MSDRTLRWLARSLGGATLVAMVVAVTLTVGDPTIGTGDLLTIALFLIGLVAFALIGFVLATRAPRNPIGWLYGAISLSMWVNIASNQYVVRGTTDLDLPSLPLVAWINSVSIMPTLAALLLALLLFPTGSPPTPRWRIVAWALVGGFVIGTVLTAFVPATLDVTDAPSMSNPMQIEAIEGWTWLVWLMALALLPAAVAALASVGVRFWRSRGEERQQLRWLLFAVVLVIVSTVAFFVTGDSEGGGLAFVFFIFSVMVALPGATAIAVLRYRLYDLDLVIKKAVVFGILVVLLMAVGLFLGLVVGGSLTGIAPDESQAVGILGLAIGFLIWPLWRLARRIADRVVYGGRASPYEVLTSFSERVGDTYASEDVLTRMATVLGEGTGAEQASVWLTIGGEPRLEAVWPPNSTSPASPGADAVPVAHQGETLGVLSVLMPASDPMTAAKERLVTDLAAQAGPVLRNVRLIEDLKASRLRLVAAQDEERRKLERNIHDGAQQQLVAIQVKQRLADGMIDRDPGQAHTLMEQLAGDTAAALDDLRDLARGIYPPLLADQGLTAAVAAQARKAAVPTTVKTDGVGRYGQDLEATVYFCTLEALNNVAKYAEASSATIRLAQHNGSLTFAISDDGGGFDRDGASYGTGLQGMADRLASVDGSLSVTSRIGEGTTVAGSIPAEPLDG